MALLPIRVLGDPVLRQETTPVVKITDELKQLAADMFDTMHAAHGVGLAAPQVGRKERMMVIEVAEQQYVLVNPEIIESEGKLTWEEGCLSIPEIYADVNRAKVVTVRATGLDGKEFELQGTDLLGVCLQHEIDHLDGKLFIDRLSLFKKRSVMKDWDEEKAKYPDFIRHVSLHDKRDARHADERL